MSAALNSITSHHITSHQSELYLTIQASLHHCNAIEHHHRHHSPTHGHKNRPFGERCAKDYSTLVPPDSIKSVVCNLRWCFWLRSASRMYLTTGRTRIINYHHSPPQLDDFILSPSLSLARAHACQSSLLLSRESRAHTRKSSVYHYNPSSRSPSSSNLLLVDQSYSETNPPN